MLDLAPLLPAVGDLLIPVSFQSERGEWKLKVTVWKGFGLLFRKLDFDKKKKKFFCHTVDI